MTKFIDVNTMSTLTRSIGVANVIERLISYLEEDYLRWGEFDKSARLAAHSEVGVIELMPIADDKRYSFKYVNGHPSNIEKNLLTVMAFGVLAEVETGYPLLLSELTLTTAIRTAATSVMAAKKLARKDAKSMALIGNGCQSEFQAIAFHTQLGINEIRCFDVDNFATEKLIKNLATYPKLKLIHCQSAKEATTGADIITTVTADKKLATIITPDMVEDGMHINGVGGDCPGKTEIAREVLERSKIYVEYEPQSRIEGDIQQLPAEHKVTEFWQVLAKKANGRENVQEITFFDSVGFALEDYSALRLIYDLACEYNLGQPVGLIPQLADSKNLFELLQSQK